MEVPMRSAIQTAILLAVILNRNEHTRARLSAKTIKILAKRVHLRRAFVAEVVDALAEYGWTLVELNTGGYGALKSQTLEAARSVSAQRGLTDDERLALRRGEDVWSRLEDEAAPEQEAAQEDE
jgi:hypothetical protein